MTTTEWMERYNRAFEDAALEAEVEKHRIDKIVWPKIPPELLPKPPPAWAYDPDNVFPWEKPADSK